MAIASSEVATGRLMNSAGDVHTALSAAGGSRLTSQPTRQAIEQQIDHRRGEQRQQLAHGETADDGEAQRPAQLRAGAGAEQQRQGAEHGRQRGHQDRPEAQHRGLEDRLLRRLAVLALGFEREVHDHDAVLLDDADQQHDADDADHVQVAAGHHQREQCADPGRRQRRQDRHRMDVALVEHAEHDVDGDQRGDQQEHLARKRVLEGLGGALEGAGDRRRQLHRPLGLLDLIHRRAERGVLGEIERDGDGRKLRQVADHQRRFGRP